MSNAIIYTEEDMAACFTAGFNFSKTNMESPSNSEYMAIVIKRKKGTTSKCQHLNATNRVCDRCGVVVPIKTHPNN